MDGCPFCRRTEVESIAQNRWAIAFHDGFPVSRGHSLVIPRRHVRSVFELSPDEYASVWALVGEVREKLLLEFQPAAFNIGVNDGTAAGQTVSHAHIHVIPRFSGDVVDPRGGVRWVIPSKADYWSKA